MARLNQAPDPLYTTPLKYRASNVRADNQIYMPSSPPLHTLPPESRLKSHGDNAFTASPLHHGSDCPSFSPADCRTLEKILCDVASPPATPSPLEQNGQSFLDGGRADSTDPAKEGSYGLVGGETTDTGYEDEDDSMELSESGEVVTAEQSITALGEAASPSISKSDRRLQASVSAHDEEEKLRYSSGRRSSATKRMKTKRTDQKRTISQETTAGDTIGDVINYPSKCNLSALPLDLGRGQTDRQTVPDDIVRLNRMRLSMEKVLEQEYVEQELLKDSKEPGVFIATSTALELEAQHSEESDLDGFDADIEETQSRFGLAITGDKINKSGGGHDPRPEAYDCTKSSTETGERAAFSVPRTPESVMRTPEPASMQVTTNHSVPQTPFTKTLSYFKQDKGVENSLSERHHDTTLPEEIGTTFDQVYKAYLPEEDNAQLQVPRAGVPVVTSALADLDGLTQSNDNSDASEETPLIQQEDDYVQVSAFTEMANDNAENTTELVASDDQKQIVLYTQHPAFINAIGMIPATMFWATAAPVVKYTSIAVDLLIEKLRDTYL